MRYLRIVAVFFVGLCALRTDAWGPDGHKIVANIAEVRLTQAAKNQIHALLDGAHLADVANWADEIRAERPETSRWHYVNIPYKASSYNATRDCQRTNNGDCVIAEIARAKKILGDPLQSKNDRAEALKFLVHFVGDLHQPLHCIERHDPATDIGDHGGQAVHVTFFGASANLHDVWDSGIIAHGGVTLDQVEKWLSMQNENVLAKGNPVQWSLAAHAQAISNSYVLPADHKLRDDYVKKNVPVVIEQLGTAGVCLARMLNSILDGSQL